MLLLLLSGPFSAAEGAAGLGQDCLFNQSLLVQKGRQFPTLRLSLSVCVCLSAHGRPHTTQLYQHVPETRWPIVYSPRYNITFMGLEKLHPFDAGKWGKVISFLKGMEGPTCTLHLLPPAHLPPPPPPAVFPKHQLPSLPPAMSALRLPPTCAVKRMFPTPISKQAMPLYHTCTGSLWLGA